MKKILAVNRMRSVDMLLPNVYKALRQFEPVTRRGKSKMMCNAQWMLHIAREA
jgi:hypothetical protein